MVRLKMDVKTGARTVAVCALLLAGAVRAEAATITLAWNANPETNIGGYILHYGTSPSSYTGSINVGNVTQYAFTEPVPGAVYFFALQAYNVNGQSSPLSNQVSSTPLTYMNFDGDARSDVGIFRPSDGSWWVKQSGVASYLVQQWGTAGDHPMAGDFDGDGKTDLALFRPSVGYWYIRFSRTGYSSAGQAAYRWGDAGDIPLLTDFDGDRVTDLTVYRPSTSHWFIWNAAGKWVYHFGSTGDEPVTGDFDGDRKTDLALYRPSTGQWLTALSTGGFSHLTWSAVKWGDPGDQPVPGDYDGDGRTDLAVYRRSNGYWFIWGSANRAQGSWWVYSWGAGADVPIMNDFDGDRRTDISVFRPSTGHWFSLLSSTGFTNFSWETWGHQGDLPLNRR
jgi:FG-GAP-like repeat/FG-GAP repeat